MTAIEQILARTKAAADQRRAEAAKRFRALVVDAAHGKELDPDKVVGFLDTAGYSVEEFQKAVELAAARIDWKEKADLSGKRLAHKSALEAKIQKIETDYVAKVRGLQTEAQAATQALNIELAEATRLVRESDTATWKLQETATAEHRETHHDLEQRISELRVKSNEFITAIHRGKQTIMDQEQLIGQSEKAFGGRLESEGTTKARGDLARAMRTLTSDQASLDDINEQIRTLEARREAATKQLLTP